jgi:hypothetical protein
MFADHQPQIAAFARRSPENFRRVACFAICTIRMPLHRAVLDTPYAVNGTPCDSIFGNKRDALVWLNTHGADLWEELEYFYERGASDDAMLRLMLTVPGIGLAKGGFILQMCYGMSGCIDTHNLTRLGIPERRYRSGHKAVDRGRIADYHDVVKGAGGTARLWDDWCTYLAERDANYPSADYVSRLHLAPLEC